MSPTDAINPWIRVDIALEIDVRPLANSLAAVVQIRPELQRDHRNVYWMRNIDGKLAIEIVFKTFLLVAKLFDRSQQITYDKYPVSSRPPSPSPVSATVPRDRTSICRGHQSSG